MLQIHATLHSSVGTDTSPAVRPMSAAQWHASTHTSDNSNRSSSSSGLTSGSSGHARPVYVTMATSPCHVSGPPNSPPRGVAEQRRGIGSHSVSVGTDIVTKKDEGSHTSTLRIDSACSGSAASSPVQRYVPQRFDSQLFTMQLNPLFFEGAADCVAEPAEFSTGDSRANVAMLVSDTPMVWTLALRTTLQCRYVIPMYIAVTCCHPLHLYCCHEWHC